MFLDLISAAQQVKGVFIKGTTTRAKRGRVRACKAFTLLAAQNMAIRVRPARWDRNTRAAR
jgi:hypothetical protein